MRWLTIISTADNIIILQTEDEEAAGTITGCIIDDPDYDPGSLGRKLGKMINSNNQSSIPAPVIPEDNKSFMEEIRKKKDMMDCFGFKDDDDEDDAILSMPATAAQWLLLQDGTWWLTDANHTIISIIMTRVEIIDKNEGQQFWPE